MQRRSACGNRCLNAGISIGNLPKQKEQVNGGQKNKGEGNIYIQSRGTENRANRASIVSITDLIMLNRMPIEMQGGNYQKDESHNNGRY